MRLSLLRAPKHPDPDCDIGEHTFSYALFPHVGSFQESGVIREATLFNHKAIICASPGPLKLSTSISLFNTNSDSIVIDTIKKPEDDDKAFVIRLYESWGGRKHINLNSYYSLKRVARVNILEDTEEEIIKFTTNSVPLYFTPFQIQTIKLFV